MPFFNIFFFQCLNPIVPQCVKHNGFFLLRKYEIFFVIVSPLLLFLKSYTDLDLQPFSDFEIHAFVWINIFIHKWTTRPPSSKCPVVSDQNSYHSTYELSFYSLYFFVHSIQRMKVCRDLHFNQSQTRILKFPFSRMKNRFAYTFFAEQQQPREKEDSLTQSLILSALQRIKHQMRLRSARQILNDISSRHLTAK